ncbi:MAG: polysaccharide deacetylase family protein [Gammaproteobacteria bacterium]
MNGRLRILYYHNIAVAPPGAALAKLYVDPHDFARQMWCLKRLGLRGVSLGEGLWHLERGQSERVIALTFDDGYADNLQHAAPTLREFRFGATCFVVTGCVGQHNLWDAAALQVRKPLMTANELRSWLAQGFEVGSHTRSHPRLDTLADESAEAEITGSRADLERICGVRADYFCYPYGAFDSRVARQVEAAGYRAAVTTERGPALAADDRFLLPRVSVSGRRGLLKFALKATTSWAAWRRPQRAA